MLVKPNGDASQVQPPAAGQTMAVMNDGGSAATIAEIESKGHLITEWATFNPDTGAITTMALPSIRPGEIRVFIINTSGAIDVGLSFYEADGSRIHVSRRSVSAAMTSVAERLSRACSGDALKCPMSIGADISPGIAD